MYSGKIQTVLGLIEPSALGCTLSHEHITMDYRKCIEKPKRKCDESKMKSGEITLLSLGWIQQNPYCHEFNLAMGDEPLEEIVKEVEIFKKEGGSSIVECTTVGIDRNVEVLAKVSSATGLNIIAGAGHFLGSTLPPEVKSASVEELSKTIVKELTEGVGSTSIKCGVIGEIGCSFPLEPEERKCLQAAAVAQVQTGAPLIIHPGRHVNAPVEIVRILQEAGADVNKTVMSHLDRTLHDNTKLLELASTSIFLAYDMFGIELSYFQPSPKLDMMSDAQRIQKIEMLVSEGHGDKVLIAHDISSRHRLVKYGGHGYGHIQQNVVPRMLSSANSQLLIPISRVSWYAILNIGPERLFDEFEWRLTNIK